MTVHDQRERLRAILAGERFVRPASIYDALSARAAEALGYELMMMAGSSASLAVLGAPDIVLLTLSEFAEQARRVTRAASLPLMVDADHGYGNALNVMRCVQELEAAGVSALSIEDTDLPRRFGSADERFLSVEEGVGKMRAALKARGDASLAILGRTSAIREGTDSAVRRAQAYEAAGVDGLFFAGIRSRAELESLRAATSLPIVLGGGASGGELDDDAYLAAQGVRIGGWSHEPIQAAARAAYETLRALRRAAVPGRVSPELASDRLLDELSHKRDYDEQIASYLRAPS
jgi:carboxyvinyl-carboxyphosphonate phosphorylmutase